MNLEIWSQVLDAIAFILVTPEMISAETITKVREACEYGLENETSKVRLIAIAILLYPFYLAAKFLLFPVFLFSAKTADNLLPSSYFNHEIEFVFFLHLGVAGLVLLLLQRFAGSVIKTIIELSILGVLLLTATVAYRRVLFLFGIVAFFAARTTAILTSAHKS